MEKVSSKADNRIDIFTDFDDSIFSDGSIDPLGLLIIWTSLGNRIFHNRLNSISTNIRSYTLNLFHHSAIQQACSIHEEKFVNLAGKAPYHNHTDLVEGMAIFLECLMAHALIRGENTITVSDHLVLPGVSKLNGFLLHNPKNRICSSIPVDRSNGILVRQHQLGIHGRHKGPFQQMDLFRKQDYYADEKLWKEIAALFDQGAIRSLQKELIQIIEIHILSKKPHGQNAIWVNVNDVVSDKLIDLYGKVLQEEIITADRFSDFWKHHLGLGTTQTTSGKIFNYVSPSSQKADSQASIRYLAEHHSDSLLQAIKVVEPFIAMVQKVMERMLTRGFKECDKEFCDFVTHQFANPEIEVAGIYPFLREEFFSKEANTRLRALIGFYEACIDPMDPIQFSQELITFHYAIMKQRGNLPWISMSDRGDVTQHRSFAYTASAKELQEGYRWVNDYYLSTVISLKEGMQR